MSDDLKEIATRLHAVFKTKLTAPPKGYFSVKTFSKALGIGRAHGQRILYDLHQEGKAERILIQGSYYYREVQQ